MTSFMKHVKLYFWSLSNTSRSDTDKLQCFTQQEKSGGYFGDAGNSKN